MSSVSTFVLLLWYCENSKLFYTDHFSLYANDLYFDNAFFKEKTEQNCVMWGISVELHWYKLEPVVFYQRCLTAT